MKLPNKLMLLFVVIMSIGIISSNYIIYYNVYKSAESNADYIMQVTTKAVQNSKIQVIDNIETSLRILAGLIRVKNFVAAEKHSLEEENSMSEFFKSNLPFLLGTKNLILVNEKGLVIASTLKSVIGFDYSDRGYFKEAFQSGSSLDGPYVSKSSGEYILTIAVLVTASNGRQAILVSSVGMEELGVITFGNILRTSGELIFIANSKGEIVNTLDKELVSHFDFIDNQSLLKDKGKINIMINGVEMQAFYENIYKNIYAFTAMPLYLIKADAITIRNRSLLLSTMVILVIATIFFFTVRNILYSIQKAIVFAKKVSNGDFKAKLEINRNDEIGEFANTLTAMVDKLAKNEELEKVQRALEKESSLMKAIIKNIPDILFVKDIDGRFQNCNDAYFKFLNKSPEDIIGKTDADIFKNSPKLIEQFTERDRRVIEYQEILTDEEWIKANDFADHLFETIRAPFCSDDGKVHGLVGISRDITLRYNQDKIIEKTKMDALEASNAKSEFLARMSHEIRTPLNGIIGMNYLALQATKCDEVRNYLNKIDNSANNLLMIVNDILDFSKIEAGKMEIESAPFNLEETINSVSDTVLYKIVDKNIKYTCLIDENIPKTLIGDPLRISQVLLNFLSNAVKFTEKGEIKLNIRLDNEDDSSVLISFTVEDTGIGMTDVHLKRLFSSFIQADGSTSRKYGGTGLGLSITKLLVELMGGEIFVTSEYNVGSTFTCIIEFAKTSSVYIAPDLKKDVYNVSDDSVSKLIGKKVLIVEDNAINQEIVKLLLKKLGIEYDVANDGFQAIDAVKKSGETYYNIVLMDIQMPNMDGYEATKRLRDMGLKVPIVAMTANAMDTDKEQAFEAGMDDHLSKPFKIEAFKYTLVKWLIN